MEKRGFNESVKKFSFVLLASVFLLATILMFSNQTTITGNIILENETIVIEENLTENSNEALEENISNI
mgnify:CR=1 FL=1